LRSLSIVVHHITKVSQEFHAKVMMMKFPEGGKNIFQIFATKDFIAPI
jgi:hypothetical protein